MVPVKMGVGKLHTLCENWRKLGGKEWKFGGFIVFGNWKKMFPSRSCLSCLSSLLSRRLICWIWKDVSRKGMHMEGFGEGLTLQWSGSSNYNWNSVEISKFRPTLMQCITWLLSVSFTIENKAHWDNTWSLSGLNKP